MTTQEIMGQLAVELKKTRPDQRKIKRLNEALDEALGTGLKDENQSLAGAWERSRRGS